METRDEKERRFYRALPGDLQEYVRSQLTRLELRADQLLGEKQREFQSQLEGRVRGYTPTKVVKAIKGALETVYNTGFRKGGSALTGSAVGQGRVYMIDELVS